MEDLKMVSLEVKYAEDMDNDNLWEYIKEELENKLEEKFGHTFDGVKVFGMVDYSQGRGIGISGLLLRTKDIEKILGIDFNEGWYITFSTEAGGHYSSYTSYNSEFLREGDGDEPAINESEIEKKVEDYLDNLGSELLKYGEEQMEYLQQEMIVYRAFENRKEKNYIETYMEINDVAYETKLADCIGEGYTQIADSGDTNIEGLWIKLPELEKHIRNITTVEDGEIVNSTSIPFYTVK